MSKAIYRVIGTLLGGCVAMVLLAAFPQDRTMLLGGFALWLGICAFVATLLRDFRSYGAALSGFTVGIIAIGVIDTPDNALIATLDRVAAVLIGIVSVLVVNSLLAGTGAFDALVKELRERTEAMTALVADALEGRPVGDDLALMRLAAGAAAVQTQATYAALELPDGQTRANGARHTIAALLAMVSASRAVAGTMGPATHPDVRARLQAVAAAMRGPPEALPSKPAPWPTTPFDAMLLERADELLDARREALAGLRTLAEGTDPMPRIRLRTSFDIPGAMLGAVRSVIAVTFCAIFCVLAGWSGATLLLIQMSAVIALLGTFPNPSSASLAFGASLPLVALFVGVANYLVLPSASGFVPFSLVVAPIALAAALTVRQPSLAPYAPAAFLYVPLLLSPANQETFNLASYCNIVMELGLSTLFTTLSFSLILKVSPSRRLYRVAEGIGAELRRTMRDTARLLDRAPAQSLLYDRMSQAIVWLGRPTPARARLLSHIYGMGELDLAIRRARSALAAAVGGEPSLAVVAAAASRSLSDGDPEAMLRSAESLLRHPTDRLDRSVLRRAASGMAGAARLTGPDRASWRFYRKLTA